MDEMFVRFFERQKGYTPDDGLVQLFLELVADESADAPATEDTEEIAG